ncbi:hypothetical protein ACTFIV_002726 [Dictyostelium citrinum]
MTFNNIKDENNDDIAIIGMGFRFPGGGNNPDQFWNQLSNKMDGISKISQEKWSRSFYEQKYINNEYGGVLKEEEWKNFDPLFFGISPKEAPTIDPQQRLLMTTLWEAFEDANIKPSTLRGSDTAVFIGMMNLDYQRCQFRDISYINPYTVTGSAGSFVSNRLSFSFDLRGPSMTLDTACSSSLNAVYLGCQAIATGDSKMAIVGGVNGIFDPSISMTFSGLNMLGHKGQCRSFDAGADGYIRSEGGGVCILKKYSDAIKDGDRIYCVIKGGSSNVDGYNAKTNITQPSMKAQGENIEIALKKSCVNPSDIYYIEAHGTGTPVGDPIEIEAISKIFKDNHTPDAPLYIGSVKSNIGHLESAAGIASLIKVALSLKNRTLVPNIHFEKPNPLIKFDDWNIRVVTNEIKFPSDKLITMGINCFGLSGSNCHMILSEAPINHEVEQTITNINSSLNNDKKEYLIPFSANCNISLDKYLEKIISNQSIYKDTILFKDFVKHQTISKSNLIKRKVITASDWDDFLKKRNETTSTSSLTSTISAPTTSTPIIYVFTGQGPQWRDMGKALYETELVFKEAVDHCDQLLNNHFGYSILQKLRSLEKDDSPEIHHPILAQPSIFLIQVGLVALYKSFGILPSIVVGHSFGEIPSALFSGVIDLETAAKIVYYRGLAQNLTIGTGRLLSIGIGAEAYLEKCGTLYPEIEIACYNDPNSIVITGSEEDLVSAKSMLSADGVFCAFLGTPCSFHSSKQEMIKEKIFNDLSDLPESKVPTVPFFSTITGSQLSDKGFYNVQYIYDNLRMPVQFTKAISNVFNFIEENESYKNAIFLEIGPHPTLGFYIPKCKPSNSTISAKPIIISPLHKKKEELSQFKLAISTLYCNGVEIDFANGQQLLSSSSSSTGDRSFKESTNQLPRYQWDFEEYWDEPNASKMVKRGPSNNLLGHDQFAGNTLMELFIDVNKSAHQYLKGHKIKGKYLFPGSGYIDNIIRQFNGQDITIFNLEFSNPFFLKDGVQHHLQTSITPTTKGEFKVEFFIKDNRNSTKWTKTSNGRVGLFKHNPKNNKLDIEKLKGQCSFTTLSKTEVYNKLLLLSLPYGPTFQRVESCSIGDGCSFFKLSMSPCSEFDKDFFNPSILDCAFHGLLVLSEGPQEIVFDRLQDMKFYSSNVPSTKPQFIYAFAKFDKIVGNSTHGSVDIMLEDGTLLITIKNVKCTSLIRLKKQSIKYPSQNVYSHHWQSKDSPLTLIENQLIAREKSLGSSSLESKINFEKLLNDKLFNDYLIRLLNQSIKSEFNEFNYKTSTVDTLEIDPKNSQLLEKIQSILAPIESLDKSIDLINLKQLVIEKSSSSFKKEINLVEKSIKRIVSLLKGGESEHLSPSNPSSPSETPRNNKNNCTSGGADDDQVEDVNQQETIDLLSDEPFNFSTSQFISNQNQLISKSIVYSFDKLINSIEIGQKKLIKIVDLSSTTNSTLSKLLLLQLNQLLINLSNNNNTINNIEIEYTIPSNSKNVESIKEETKSISKALNIKYRSFTLQDDLESQGYLTSNYDLIITSLLLVSTNSMDANQVLSKLYKLLLPKGQLILMEPPKDVLSFNLLLANDFQQSFDIKSKQEIKSLIRYCGFTKIETNHITQDDEQQPSSILVVQAEKRDIESMSLTFSSDPESLNTSYSNCILIVSKEQKENPTSYIQEYLDITEIFCDTTTIVQADDSELLTKTIESVGKNDIIFFLVSLEQLTIENYKQVTMQYTLVNQILLRNNLSTRFALLTSDSQNGGTNYLGSSLVGTYRYFLEFPSLNIFSIDVDKDSIENLTLFLRLVDPSTIGDRETIVRDNKVLVQKIFKEPTLLSPSTNYEKDTNNLYLNTNSNLDFAFQCKEKLANGFVEIKVMSTGINYKDNLFYRGLLPQEIFTKGDIYSPPFGLECAGYITRVAPGVTRFKVGDQVVGFASHSLSSHVTTHQDKIVLKPENVSFTEAAAVCVVYATSYYSVFHVGAFMTDKESILVHSATGGVGLATLNLLKWKRNQLKDSNTEITKDASIYATVGSKEKVDYLQEKYGDLITAIYNSRDTEYCDEIKQQSTQGGVDLILNTLSGDYLSANFRSLSQVGRIMDLSVTQLVENDSLDFSNFKYHVGYNTIDLERASKYNSKVVRDILTEVFDAIADGSLENIPVKVFPSTQVKTAIEYINERVHIGKIVVDFENFDQDILKPALQEKENPIQLNKVKKLDYTCDTLSNTILITGQTGIAVHILKWIISGSVNSNNNNKSQQQQLTDFIILSRSSLKWELENLINQTKHKYGDRFRFHYKSVNIADLNATRTAIDQVYQNCKDVAPIKSVLHFATVYEYISPEDITQTVIDNTHNPKAVGAINLHNLSIENDWKLENFILFSSIGAIIGGSKQSAYSSANLVLDSLANYRKSIGLAATSINWGGLDAGGVAATDKSVASFLEGQGILLVSLAKILGCLDSVFQPSNSHLSNFMLSSFNTDNLLASAPQMKRKMDHHLTNYQTSSANSDATLAESGSVQAKVINTISELLSIHPSKLNLDTRLKDYGIDSLLTVQLKNWIDKEFTKNLFTHLQLSSSSINSIIQRINSKSTTSTSTPNPTTTNSIKQTSTNTTTKPSVAQTTPTTLDTSMFIPSFKN